MNMDMFYVVALSAICLILAILTSQFDKWGWKQTIKNVKQISKLEMMIVPVAIILISIYGYWLYGWSRDYVGLMLLSVYLLAVSVTDLRSRLIPDRTTILFAIIFLLFQLSLWDWTVLFNSLLGIVAGALLPCIVYLINKNSIGFGDVKMIACIGMMAGFPSIFHIMVRAMIVCFVYAIVLLIIRRASLKSELPFAPFMLVGALL